MGADGFALSPQDGAVVATASMGLSNRRFNFARFDQGRRSIGGVIFKRLSALSELAQRTQSRLAPAAASPAGAATAATPASTTASPPAPAATCASTAPTTPPGRLYASLERCVVLIVEDVEGRQVDVGNFFLTEEQFVMRCGILHRHIHRRSSS
jgi:hypothetical protein